MRETIIDHPRSRPSILPAGWSLFRVAADGGHWRSVGGLSVDGDAAHRFCDVFGELGHVLVLR
jgi:hypothetical protein